MAGSETDAKWIAWLSRRTPAVRERILRLNQTLRPGERLRGYYPHKRTCDRFGSNLGKGKFIRRYGRQAWSALPKAAIRHDGHRKFISYEDERDMIWTTPADHPYRRARRIGKGFNQQIVWPNGEYPPCPAI